MQLSHSQYGLNRQVTGIFLARILPTMFSKRGFCHYAEIPWSYPANDKKAANSTVNIEGRKKILHLHLLFSQVLTLVFCTINMV